MEAILKSYYLDPKNPASFGGIDRLYNEVKKHHDVSLDEVRAFLSNQLTYSLHKDRKYKFKRNRIIVLFKNFQWESDLIDWQAYANENDGMRFMLVVIDCFTKKAWLRPLRDKKPESVKSAFINIFETDNQVPHRLRTDKGKEFDCKTMHRFYEDFGIIFFTSTNSTIKCSIVERLNRTLKSRIFRMFTHQGNHRIIDNYQDFVDSYNNSYHRSIKMTPQEATNSDSATVFSNLYGGKSLRELLTPAERPKADVGDTVRIGYDPGIFDKSYHSTFTDQTAKVQKVTAKSLPMYSLVDYRDKQIPRRFYGSEIQKVEEPKYRIEKILRTRIKNGEKQYYIKWLNHPASDNSWITDIEDV